jgi:hypothetical protein
MVGPDIARRICGGHVCIFGREGEEMILFASEVGGGGDGGGGGGGGGGRV